MRIRRILCVSFDKVASENRCGSLREAGYDVRACTSVQEGLDLLSQEPFDAVIVGHRFSAEERYLLAVEAKEKANIPVILVCGTAQDYDIPASSRVYALEGSMGLLSALSRLCPVEATAPPQAA
jgi:DNA-binding response OmpR family regulator